MAFISLPVVLAQATSTIPVYGFCDSPPIVWHSLASAWNAESSTGIQGRYLPQVGEVHSVPTLKRQDTFLTGTAGRTGINFDVVAGTWKDDLRVAQYQVYSLSKPSGAYESTESSVVQHTPTSDIQWMEIVVRRGFPPIIASPGPDLTHSKTDTYAYIHLAYQSPDLQDYRISLEYNQPIRLDVTYDGGTTWTACAIARELGNVDRYLESNGSQIRLTIKPSPDFKTIGVEVGDGSWLVHSPDPALLQVYKNINSTTSSDHLLPRNGSIRFAVQNGSFSAAIYPFRHDDVIIDKSPRDFGRQVPNSGNAFVVSNSLANTDPNQTSSATVNTDGQKFSYSLTTSMPDAGDGLGSTAPAILSDAALVIPSNWVTSFDDFDIDTTIYTLPVVKYVEISNIDDVHRCGYTRGILTLDNHTGFYANSYSNAAISVATSVDGGGAFAQRLTGVTQDREGGIKLNRADPQRLIDVPFIDKSRMMDVGIQDEWIADGWCIYSAVRYLAEQGNIHPSFLDPEMPLYVPPGASVDAPYGVSGPECPYYSLPRGTGLNPRFKFMPGESAWNILTLLASISGDIDPVSGARLPFYTAFDENGCLFFKAVDFASRPIVAAYSSNDPTGVGAIQELTIFNSMADVRTSLDFQGISSETFELLYQHIDQSSATKAAKGWRESWLERNAMYSDASFLSQTAELAAYEASLPVQSIVMKVPYNPFLFTGMNVAISDDVTLGDGVTVVANVKEIRSVISTNPNGMVDAFSLLTCRNIITPY